MSTYLQLFAWKPFQYITIILVCFICYNGGRSFSNEFVFDDIVAIVQNPDVTSVTTTNAATGTNSPKTNLTNIFLHHDFWGGNITKTTSHKSYRPLVTLTYNIEYRLFGELNAIKMKLINLLLHCLATCLLIPVLTKLCPQLNSITVFIVTILFGVHPIHTEAVASLVGRAELLCLIFYLLSIWLYIKIDQSAWSIINLLKFLLFICLYGLSLISKETGITVVPVCISYDIIKNLKISTNPFNYNKFLLFKMKIPRIWIPLVGLLFIFIYCRLWIINFEQPKFKDMDNPVAAITSWKFRIINQTFLYALNGWLLICPDWLSFDWALGSIQLLNSVTDVRILGILLFLLKIFLLIYTGSRTILLALALTLVPFLPSAGLLVKLGFVIAERVLYTPSVGFCLLIGIGLDKLCEFYKSLRMFLYATLTFIIIIMILKCQLRTNEWNNSENLFRSGLRVCPNNAKIYYNLGKLLSNKPSHQVAAMSHYHKAISLYPEYEAALMNLGNLYREKNNLDLAEHYLNKSIMVVNEFPAAWMNLGIVYAMRGKFNNALIAYKQAIKYRKNYATCYYNMGNLYIAINDSKMALKYWELTVSIDPKNSKAWSNILTYLDNSGQAERVIHVSELALEQISNNNDDITAVLFTRANAFGKLNRFTDAEQLYKKIVKLRPQYPLYLTNLAVLYHRWNKPNEAIKFYQQTLMIDPKNKGAKLNLNKLQKKIINKRN